MKQVVLVAMLDSIHTVRWIQTWQKRDPVEFILVPSGPHRKPHPELISMIYPNGPIREISGGCLFGGLISYSMDKFLGTSLQLRNLEAAVAKWCLSNYYLHYLETQHSGYLVLKFLENQVPQIVIGTNWGSDLFWFQRLESHRTKISQLLMRTDRYLVECERDYELASEFGFRGQKTIVGPNSFVYRPQLEGKKEDLIVVKGYQGWAGLSHLVLRALVKNRDMVKSFRIVVFSASKVTALYCKYMKTKYGLDITTYSKHALTQEQMKDLFARSRIYIGASKTDGISTSALEAMNQGAVPIQTSTSCINTLLKKGAVGFAPEPTELDIGNALISAIELTKEDFVDMSKSVELLKDYGSEEISRARFQFAYDIDF